MKNFKKLNLAIILPLLFSLLCLSACGENKQEKKLKELEVQKKELEIKALEEQVKNQKEREEQHSKIFAPREESSKFDLKESGSPLF